MAINLDRWTIPNPGLKISRSRFPMPHTHTTTMNAGRLYPVAQWEILPGDTFSIPYKAFARMQTPIHPVMDNAFLEVAFFYCADRLVWEHWKEFMGESPDPFMSDTEYEIPLIELEINPKGSIYDHFELPQFGVSSNSMFINALPIRMYGLIWSEWYRDQNVSHALDIPRGDATALSSPEGDILEYYFSGDYDMTTEWLTSGIPLPVAKYHDLFTSALPQPQRGPAVTLPITDDLIPVGTYEHYPEMPDRLGNEGLVFMDVTTGSSLFSGNRDLALDSLGTVKASTDQIQINSSDPSVTPRNLVADASQLSAFSINTFRQAYAMQRLFERDARSGSRYVEYIEAAFGVRSPDGRQQRPEFIGGKRIPISMTQVPQTSATDDVSPQGNTAAFSLTRDYDDGCTYSATEHGYIIAVACIRTEHTYQQGIDKTWLRRRRFDFYDPVFANLGEQPIQNQELVWDPDGIDNEETFGFQEAWYEYRYKQSRICGEMSSMYSKSLDVWHYGDIFGSWNDDRTKFNYLRPTLSPEFIYETAENVDRTLTVSSNVSDQFFVQIGFDTVAVRPMPLYSVPGLSGHF